MEHESPPPPKRRKKTRIIALRMTPEFYEQCQSEADGEYRELSDWIRKTLVEALTRKGLSKRRLRGNLAGYVNSEIPLDIRTCSVHEGEPLYATAHGAACVLCTQEQNHERPLIRGTGT